MASDKTYHPIGYAWLADTFKVNAMPHHVESFVAEPGERRTIEQPDGRRREIHPWSAIKLKTACDHLEFALKREGLHLELLRAVLPQVPAAEVASFVRATPTGAFARRLWYLWERLTNTALDIPDVSTGNYAPLADSDLYYTGPEQRYSRWRIIHNLIGNIHFSPMLRRSKKLVEWQQAGLAEKCMQVLDQYPPNLYQRALSWLYSKETKSSYAIEQEVADETRTGKFIGLLRAAGEQDYFSEKALCSLQQAIVDPRFSSKTFRTTQNFVGQTLAPGVEDVHLVPPKPGKNLTFLMENWAKVSNDLATRTEIPPVPAAAIVAYLFVFFHPFIDGNGRIHRFLIHHVLARRKFGPDGIVFPVSAVMLNRPKDYDASLEAFSVPLRERSEYTLTELNDMTVTNRTLDHFRYVDCTLMAEALCSFVAETIETELPRELAFLRCYDVARTAMREIVDLPEPHANLFLKLALQNQGRLSKKKRSIPQFEELTDTEITGLEEAIRTAYAGHLPEPDSL
jgi:hypothetical protein